jgi:ubiquinol-cytochrome c reductase cytochrome c subunit
MMDPRRAGRGCRDLAALVLATAVALTVVVAGRAAMAEQTPDQDTLDDASFAQGDPALGGTIFRRDCAVCHGPEGSGTDKARPITDVGTAAIHFQVTTKRMPIPDPDAEIRRGVARRINGTPVDYSPEEIAALLAYTGQWITGPEVPEVEPVPGDRALAPGGEAYRTSCAVCHQLAGRGGVLLADIEIPDLLESTRVQVVEAIRTGPGAMPAFGEDTIPAEEARLIAAYVTQEIQRPTDPGGWGAGHLGPWAEGWVVWAIGIPSVLLAAAWIGRRT